MTILTAGVDLSVGSVVALSGTTAALVTTNVAWLDNATVFIIVALLCGAAVGVVNGAGFVYGRLPHPFIVTLATLGIASGVALLISGGEPISTVPPFIVSLGLHLVLGIPVPVFVVLGVAILGSLFLHTQWGRWIYAVGANRDAAERVGIPSKRVLLSVYVFSGLCAGVAGILATALTATASPIAGTGYELNGITAVIIGGASFFGGRGSVGNVVVGALIFTVISNCLNLLNVASYWQFVVTGTVVLLAVELDVIRRALEQRLRGMQALGQQ
jgi:ribose transport system permease protein